MRGAAEADIEDEFAATATVRVPIAADALVTLIVGGFVQVTPGGKLAAGQVMATIPMKPPLGVTVIVDVPLLPTVTVAAVGAGVKVNDPVVVAVTVTVAFPAPEEAEPV